MSQLPKVVAAAVLFSSAGVADQANGVSLSVKMACATDYYTYCSQHKPGSADVRKCMRAHGRKLSSRCINALVDAGYISKAYVASRRTAH